MFVVVYALSSCQNNMDAGYFSAFMSEQFDCFEALKLVWAPYYTIHKILASPIYQHLFANNAQALNIAEWMVDYFYNRVQNLILKYILAKQYQSFNEETGLLAVKADHISDFHANTHIQSQLRYEVTGDLLYKQIGIFFMDILSSSYTYATGGTSFNKFWKDPKRLATFLGTENEESCTTCNMLKVSRHLFRWTKEMTYTDYYERALTNGVLSIQRGRGPGVMICMLPLGHGESKSRSENGWGIKFDSFWCCYGTGIESFSKLGDSIYFEEEGKVPGIDIIQYISSSFDWTSGKILFDMKVEHIVSWDNRLCATVKISSKEQGSGQSSTLNFRTPFWAHSNATKAVLNGQELSLPILGFYHKHYQPAEFGCLVLNILACLLVPCISVGRGGKIGTFLISSFKSSLIVIHAWGDAFDGEAVVKEEEGSIFHSFDSPQRIQRWSFNTWTLLL